MPAATPYEVFARSRRGDPLRHIGVVHAPGDELARLYARWLYDEENWTDIAVVRRDHVLTVTATTAATVPDMGRDAGLVSGERRA